MYNYVKMRKKVCLALLILVVGCKDSNDTSENTAEEPSIPVINYSVKKTLPHDTLSFTEGFLVHNGQLFESTGAPQDYPTTKSEFGIVDSLTGKLAVKGQLDRNTYFAEGITILNNKLYQLTYKNREGFVYDLATFKKIKSFKFTSTEGWGMTTDGTYVIMSDGTANLTYLDPETLALVKTINVTEDGYQRQYINELEYIKGFIYANVWGTTKIVKIDPKTGNVVGTMDLARLMGEAQAKYPGSTDLNGIAYDAQADRIYITGKLWPTIYEISFPH